MKKKRISLSRDIVLFYSYNMDRPESLDTIKRLLVKHITYLRNRNVQGGR